MKPIILSASLLLTACVTTPVTPVPAEPAGTCRRDALASFVGRPYTAALGARMLRASKASKLRPVAKGMMVTMDFSADRLTIYLDAANRVERATCG